MAVQRVRLQFRGVRLLFRGVWLLIRGVRLLFRGVRLLFGGVRFWRVRLPIGIGARGPAPPRPYFPGGCPGSEESGCWSEESGIG